MTKLFESGGTTNIGPQHQRGGGGGGLHQAYVKAAPQKTSPFGKQGREPTKPATPKTAAPKTETPKTSGGDSGGYSNETNRFKIANDAAKAAKNVEVSNEQVFTPTGDDLSAMHVGGAGLGGDVLTGSIKTQLEALKTAEGAGRSDYNWTTMGEPQGVSESLLFLSSAAYHPANNISIVDIDQAMLANLKETERRGEGAAKEWAASMLESYEQGGSKVYIQGDKILSSGNRADAELINQRNNLETYRMGALNMVEGHRLEQRDIARGAITQGFQMAQIGLTNVGSAQAAQISADASRYTAQVGAQTAERTEASRRAGALEIQTLAGQQEQEAITAGGKEARATAVTGGEQERLTVATRGEQDRQGMRVMGEEERKGIQERTSGRLQEIDRETAGRLDTVRQQGANMMSQLDRQFEGEGRLLEMTQDYNVEIQQTQQQFQASESAKQRALDEGDQENFRYQVNVQAMVKREENQLRRWEKNVDTVLALGQNPAMLFHLNSTGMLPSILGDGGNLGSGMNVTDIVGELTAIIDPANVPNIQGFNTLSHIEQQILGWNLSATRGFGEGDLQRTMQGGTPFTRGQQSQVRVGGTRSPFEAGNI